jgi:hypothetical protein
MDPLGFGLEHYDAIGRYRTREGTHPVDASGVLPDGTMFEGVEELSKILSEDPKFEKCITKKFMTYAGGRLLTIGLGAEGKNDERWVDALSSRAEAEGGSLRSIMRAVLLSEPFRSRVPSGG